MINKGAETLPNKDAQTFKQLAKFYDAKNFKKGLKNTEKLLESHPDHPQTNALKALFLQAIGQQAKAIEVAKLALIKSKMASQFCWHTCGTIYKMKKDFYEAAKCFQNALKYQSDNTQLMRDVASLQVQVRDYTNFTATRFALLKQKPNMIQNWVGFTISHHLRGDFASLFKALSSLDNLIKTTELKPTQLAHYYLYRVIAFRDAQKYEGMYEELIKNKHQIKDQVLYYELLFKACSQLGKIEEATKALQVLIKKYPENIEYLDQYQNLNHLTKRQAYARAHKEFKSKIAKSYELACIQDDGQFKKQFQFFAKPYYQKNLISLFTEIHILYTSGKEKLIQQIFLSFQKHLSERKYPDGSSISSPSEYLWSLYLLSQHYSRNFSTLELAYDYINRAIKHTCTVPEFYLVKAEIEFKMHNNFQSLKTINEARKTDLADRYMNNICVKYILKCEFQDIAEVVMRLFMREESNLYDLQTQWYIIDVAKSFLKQRNFEAGLKHLDFVQKHFIEFQANEFDFHTYCIRKWTLREYTELIEFNDNVYDNKKYAQAAGIALKYLKQYVHKVQEDEAKNAKVEEEQTKEEEAKKKKKKKKAVAEVVELAPFEAYRKKIDYHGKEYSEKIRKNPLQEALNYAKCVSSIKYSNKQNFKQNKLFGKAFAESIDVFIHFKKPLLVLRSLNKLEQTNFCPFEIHFATIKSINYLQSYLIDPKSNDMAKQIITDFLNKKLQGGSLALFNEKKTAEWTQSVPSNRSFLISIKKFQAEILLKNLQPREELISFYLKQLQALIQGETPSSLELEKIFYFTHKLQFHGRLSQHLRQSLNKRVNGKTTYFSQWKAQVPKMPESTWTIWWLSDYDIEREEKDQKDESQKSMQVKQNDTKKEPKALAS